VSVRQTHKERSPYHWLVFALLEGCKFGNTMRSSILLLRVCSAGFAGFYEQGKYTDWEENESQGSENSAR